MGHNFITELSEERLDELLAYAPDFTAENLDNISSRCLQKKASRRKIGRRTILAAAVAALIISLSGMALAVSTGFGSLGNFYSSLFNNPDAEGRIEIGQTVVSNGIELTLLSAFVDGHTAYLTIELRDLEGSRLTGSMRVLNEDFSKLVPHVLSVGPVIYYEAENKATMVVEAHYGRNISELGTATFIIDTIQSSYMRTRTLALEFDIDAHAADNESVSLEQWHGMLGGGSGYSTGAGYDKMEKGGPPWEIGEPEPRPLKPGDMNAVIGGFDWAVVSNAGVADGFLHVQIRFIYDNERDLLSNKYSQYANFCIIDGNGNATGIYYQVNNSGYLNMMFEIDADAGLSDLTLALWGDEFIPDNIIRGLWSIDYAVDKAMPNRALTAYTEDSPVIAKVEVTSSPVRTSMQLTAHGVVIDENNYISRPAVAADGYEDKTASEKMEIQRVFGNEIAEYYRSFDTPHLTLDDGSIIVLWAHNEMIDWFGVSVWWPTVYFDIERLQSITICGVEYFFP